MAKQQFSGLFQGPNQADIRQLQSSEREARIRQAMADVAGAGGGFQAANMARITQQGNEALGTLGQGIATKLGGDYEDPRLTSARKRESDKSEIIGILGEFNSPDSEDGAGISENEMQQGFSELMSRGYTQEAQEFLKMAQSMAGVRIDEIKAKQTGKSFNLRKSVHDLAKRNDVKSTSEVGDFQDASGRKFKKIALVMKDGTTDTKTIPWDGDESIPPQGVLSGIDASGQETLGRIKEAKQKVEDAQSAKLESDQKLADFKATAQVKSDYIKGGILARRGKPKAMKLLELARQIDGGDVNAAFAGLKKNFNVEAKNVAEFRTGTQLMLLKMLKPLMGAKATDQDLIELKNALANPAQSTQANILILERFISQMDTEMKAGDYFGETKGANLQGYNEFLKGQEATENVIQWGDLK